MLQSLCGDDDFKIFSKNTQVYLVWFMIFYETWSVALAVALFADNQRIQYAAFFWRLFFAQRWAWEA